MTAGFTARHPRLLRALATGFVALAALLAAVWLAPRASGTAATWLRTPAVHLRTLHAPGDGSLRVGGASGRAASAPLTFDAGMRFSMAGVVCDPPAAGSATIRLRTSLDGASWSRWYRAPLEVGRRDRPRRGVHRPLVDRRRPLRPGAPLPPALRRAPAKLSGVRLVAIDPVRGVQPRHPRRRHAPPRRGHSGRCGPRAAGARLHHPAGHRHPRRVGRRREAPLGLPLVLAGQDGLHPPHRQRQPLHAGRCPGARARHLRVPHQGSGLERHRLQLRRRPLRHRLRGQVRRHDPGSRRRAGLRLQHGQHRHLRHGHLHRRRAAGRGRRGAGAPARLEAERRRSRSVGDSQAHLRRRREVQDGQPSSRSRSSPVIATPTTPSAPATHSTPSSPPSAPTWPGAWAAAAPAAPRRSPRALR